MPKRQTVSGQLVGTLQARFGVPAGSVLTVDQPESEAGIGRYFPTSAFRQSLLPGALTEPRNLPPG